MAEAKEGTVTLTFSASACTFPAGHELRVYLASSNSPRFEASAEAANVTVKHERAALELPVVE